MDGFWPWLTSIGSPSLATEADGRMGMDLGRVGLKAREPPAKGSLRNGSCADAIDIAALLLCTPAPSCAFLVETADGWRASESRRRREPPSSMLFARCGGLVLAVGARQAHTSCHVHGAHTPPPVNGNMMLLRAARVGCTSSAEGRRGRRCGPDFARSGDRV